MTGIEKLSLSLPTAISTTTTKNIPINYNDYILFSDKIYLWTLSSSVPEGAIINHLLNITTDKNEIISCTIKDNTIENGSNTTDCNDGLYPQFNLTNLQQHNSSFNIILTPQGDDAQNVNVNTSFKIFIQELWLYFNNSFKLQPGGRVPIEPISWSLQPDNTYRFELVSSSSSVIINSYLNIVTSSMIDKKKENETTVNITKCYLGSVLEPVASACSM